MGEELQPDTVSDRLLIAYGIGPVRTWSDINRQFIDENSYQITDKDASHITRRLDMTKVGRILQEREDKAIAEAVAEARKETRKETRKEYRKEAKEEKRQSAIKLLKTGDSVEKVSECMGLTLKEVRALAAKV